MGELEGAREREDERDVFGWGCGLFCELDCWGRTRGDSTGERRVVVDVEFEKVEEGVCYYWYCAIEFCQSDDVSCCGLAGTAHFHTFFNAIHELQRLARLIAYRKGNILEFVSLVGNMFACITIKRVLALRCIFKSNSAYSHAPVQTTNFNLCAVMVTG
jgi:hypothetical protein